jgi:protein involved in polysaccharide export with SLBB domain
MKTTSKLLKFLVVWVTVLASGWISAEAQLANRKIQPNDVLIIRVLNEPDMTQEAKVTNDGRVNYFFIGDVEVGGKTIGEAKSFIQEALNKDYLVDPQVSIEVRQYALQVITVLGAVNKAGQVQLPPDRQVDIVEAIGLAGDFNRYANKSRIELRRRGQNTRYSYDDLRKLTDPAKKVYVEPDDVIDVAESKF